ncbi:vacuolar sorting protein [Cyclospora cayetanensis]|uniref:Vacuolar sorting protein n=1 Tax=Cyclospora cayetanensis TaxID=88456 RepID=A0A1D3CYA4_9EIME|nr:vacuolar sorting protein [Cyclospora cayetanensis]
MACKDTLAQQYLLDCVVQVFSDECHLQTLDLLLSQTANVQRGVALKPVLVNLLNRITSFLQGDPEALPKDISVFDIFRNFLESQVDAAILAYSGGSSGTPAEPPSGGCMDLSSLLAMQVAFLNFCLALFPSRVDYVAQILDSAHRLLSMTCQRASAAVTAASVAAGGSGGRSPPSLAKLRGSGIAELSASTVEGSYTASAAAVTDPSAVHLKPLPEAGMDALMDLLAAPLRVLSLQVLSIESYSPLMDFLDVSTRHQVASTMVSAVVTAGMPLSSAESLGRFLTLVSPLLRDEVLNGKRLEEETGEPEETEAAKRQLQQMAMLVHLARAPDTDDYFNLLLVAKSKFSEGGPSKLRVLLPPLVVSACRLLPSVLERQQQAEQRIEDVTMPAHGGKKICQFLHATCLELVQISAEMAFRMWLMAAMAADNACEMVGGYEAICHEFLSQALVCFEEEITESKRQFAALTEMVGCLSGFVRRLDRENYDSIASKLTQHGAKLLKKPDQCRAVLSCSHLYWNAPEYRDSRRVLECLQKCLKIADICVQASTSHVSLFIEILDKYVYYFDQNNPEVTVEFIQNLVALCAEHCRFAELVGRESASPVCVMGVVLCLDKEDDVMKNFRNTLQHLKRKKQAEGGSKYRGLDLSIDI